MKKTAFVVAGALLVSAVFTATGQEAKAEGKIPVYRIFNSETGEHLYTTDSNEVAVLKKTGLWKDEGVAWEAPAAGNPVYRLFNANANDHLFTSDENEKALLKSMPGWSVDNDEKPLFYSGGKGYIYRLFNTVTGKHLLTSDYNEFAALKGTGEWNEEFSGISAASYPGIQTSPSGSLSKDAKTIDAQILIVDHRNRDIYTSEYQQEADNALNLLKGSDERTFDKPLVVSNPYGTYSTSLYYYAKTDTASYAECTILSEGASVVKQRLKTLNGEKLVKEHEYQIIGLVPGQENTVNMRFYDASGKLISDTVFTYTPEEDEHYLTISGTQYGNSKNQLKEGFFYLFGHDKAKVANIYVFDNEGTPRGLIPLNSYRSDRFLFIDDYIAYSYNTRGIAFVNRLGRVEKRLSMPGFKFHHDYSYDEETRTILCLANEIGTDTIEDILVGINVDTGECKKLVDFKNLLPEIKAMAVQNESGLNTYGGTELDWIHINAVDVMGNGQAVFSSREHSSIYKLSDIYNNPTVDYIIHGGKLYSGTKYDDLRLEKIGDFVSQAGQHFITYQKDESLPEGQYYLYMYNNNHSRSATLPDFDWSMYPGTGSFNDGDHSSFYKYLVDETTGTYKLVKDIHIPYSSIVSNVQDFGENVEFSSGMAHSYGEYDANGNMIRTFIYDADKYAYRIMKYDMVGFYYD